MLRIMVAARDSESLKDLESGLHKRDDIELIQVFSKKDALERIEKDTIDVVITDAELLDDKPLSLVSELMQRSPLVNCAMVSSLPPEEFHEYTEGLGVFMQLPLHPGEKEIEKMLTILDSINALLRA